MNPVLETVYPTAGYSFCVQYFEDRRLHFNWHYHQEVELIIVQQGEGQAHIGDTVKHFQGASAFLIGSSVPHGIASIGNLKGWIIQFLESNIHPVHTVPEFEKIQDLLIQARRGIFFPISTIQTCASILDKFNDITGLLKWMYLVQLLHILSIDSDKKYCSLRIYDNNDDNMDLFEQTVTKVFNQANRQFRLHEISNEIGLTVSAFCKIFKRKYGIPFVEYVNSIRLNNAKKLLIQTNLYIDDICYDSGFNNISFFNRKFKRTTGMTPSEFRKLYKTT